MRYIYKFIVSVLGLLVSLFLTHQAGAQDLTQYVKQENTPAWVSVQEASFDDNIAKSEGNRLYRLSDLQQRISQTTHERYRHNVIELKTSEAVKNNSNFSIAFDPSYQKISIHNFDIIRGGKKLNRLELSDFDFYRVETDREKLLYDGTMEIALIMEKIQPLDLIIMPSFNYSFPCLFSVCIGVFYYTKIYQLTSRHLTSPHSQLKKW